jgi:hypothetical protein
MAAVPTTDLAGLAMPPSDASAPSMDDRSAVVPLTERQPVLVLGGTHFIGRATVAALLATGRYDLTLFNRGRTRHPFGPRVAHAKGNRRDPAAVASVLRSKPRWHAVVDCIAFTPKDLEPILMHRYAPSLPLTPPLPSSLTSLTSLSPPFPLASLPLLSLPILRSKPRWHAVVDCIAFTPKDLEPILMHR